jgi:hypothetical protein
MIGGRIRARQRVAWWLRKRRGSITRARRHAWGVVAQETAPSSPLSIARNRTNISRDLSPGQFELVILSLADASAPSVDDDRSNSSLFQFCS